MTAACVYDGPTGLGVDDIESALLDAFRTLRAAVEAGQPAVVIVRDSDLLGHGEPADAAVAAGLVGMVRAFATEGTRDGWVLNALAVDPDVTATARAEWIARLSEPNGITGELVRLGPGHLGRIPV
jgi:NAD(P)-dependent dehydrogenase (short-subunit alcohol dehydrogenase family)